MQNKSAKDETTTPPGRFTAQVVKTIDRQIEDNACIAMRFLLDFSTTLAGYRNSVV